MGKVGNEEGWDMLSWGVISLKMAYPPPVGKGLVSFAEYSDQKS